MATDSGQVGLRSAWACAVIMNAASLSSSFLISGSPDLVESSIGLVSITGFAWTWRLVRS